MDQGRALGVKDGITLLKGGKPCHLVATCEIEVDLRDTVGRDGSPLQPRTGGPGLVGCSGRHLSHDHRAALLQVTDAVGQVRVDQTARHMLMWTLARGPAVYTEPPEDGSPDLTWKNRGVRGLGGK